jgi:hypothetical protein
VQLALNLKIIHLALLQFKFETSGLLSVSKVMNLVDGSMARLQHINAFVFVIQFPVKCQNLSFYRS